MTSSALPGARVGLLSDWISLAPILSFQAGNAIWWAGTQNARIGAVELRLTERLVSSPETYRQVTDADRRIAVIDQRIEQILRRLDRITEAIQRSASAR
jgi:hypothetical protein